MQRSLLGVFTVCLCAICVLAVGPALKKKRYGLAIFFLLNAISNLVATIQAFYGNLF